MRGATSASSTHSIASPAVTRRWSRLRQHRRPPLQGRREFKVPNALIHPLIHPLVVIQTVKPSS